MDVSSGTNRSIVENAIGIEDSSLSSPSTINTYIITVICAVLSIGGLITNGLVVFVFLYYQKMRNQFTLLCVSLAGADCGVLIIFLIWVVPMTITQSTLSTEFVGLKIGQISLLFWFAGLYSTLAIAANRFLAIASPVKYKSIFSQRNTICLIAVCWFLACLHEIVYVFDGCDFYYDNTSFLWLYSTTYCGQMIGWILDLGYGVLFFILVFTLNIATFYKIRRANRLLNQNNQSSNVAAGALEKTQNQANQERRRHAEIRLFKLACIHSGIFELMLLCFHLFSRMTTETWGIFFTTTFMWQFAHASNGFIYIVFNRDVRVSIKLAILSMMAKFGCNADVQINQVQPRMNARTEILSTVQAPMQFKKSMPRIG